MGLTASRFNRMPNSYKNQEVPETYETYAEVQEALRKAGLEACQLIVGVDFTKSNEWNGFRTLKGKSLHHISETLNPYQDVFQSITETLADFDDDKAIPCYGFGDITTQQHSVFSFNHKNRPSDGLDKLTVRYKEIVKHVKYSGPTSFAPLIRQAMRDVVNSGMRFHLLLIIADGYVSDECIADTEKAIITACEFPLAIVVVGVGDGPWDKMQRFDDNLPDRPWDNFQFVDYESEVRKPSFKSNEERQASFAMHTLMELPKQYERCKYFVGNKVTNKRLLRKLNQSASELKDPPDSLLTQTITPPAA